MKTRLAIRTLFAAALFALAVLALPAAPGVAAEAPAEIVTPAETVDAEVDCLADEVAEPVEDLDALFGAQLACSASCDAQCEQVYQDCLQSEKCQTSPSFCNCELNRQVCMNLCCS